jgi:hypothetical protein
MRRKLQLAREIVAERHLMITPSRFICPYCDKTWRRGGGHEGFVKSAALNHVPACWEIVLWDKGYAFGPYLRTRGRTAVPCDQATPYYRRLVRANRAARRRRGLYPHPPVS